VYPLVKLVIPYLAFVRGLCFENAAMKRFFQFEDFHEYGGGNTAILARDPVGMRICFRALVGTHSNQ